MTTKTHTANQATEVSARIIAHSKNAVTGKEIITYVITCHRFILAEFNTHRMLSRNSASSRAIPTKKMIANIWKNPAIPVSLGANCKGMQAGNEITGWKRWLGVTSIRLWSKLSCLFSMWLNFIGIHKQIANRYIEPFMYTTIVVTATDWDNFFALRAHKAAQPEFQELAFKMLEVFLKSSPKVLQPGEWHLPFADQYVPKGLDESQLLKIVTARCARVSYVNFEGNIEHEKDYVLHDSLIEDGHSSPTEHAGQCSPVPIRSGNFEDFIQYRKTIPRECRTNVDYQLLLEQRG